MKENALAAVKGEKVVIINQSKDVEQAIIVTPKIGKVLVNGKTINGEQKVDKNDLIVYVPETVIGSRIIKIDINEDKTEAYIIISYMSTKTSRLIEKEFTHKLILEVEEIEIEPKKFKESEILAELEKQKIIFGINYEEIKKLTNGFNGKVLIAEGIKMIKVEEDLVQILAKIPSKALDENSNKTIDYRDVRNIYQVKAGEVIARIIIGNEGQDGTDIFGKKISKGKKKKLSLKPGKGCKVINNEVIAEINGQLTITDKKIEVNEVYNINTDVNIENGNVNFNGDVTIQGQVMEGMKVKSGAGVVINNGVFGGKVFSKNNSIIKGNIIDSVVKIGGEVVEKEILLKSLECLKADIRMIINEIEYMKKNNNINENVNIGQLIRLLIETKHCHLIRSAMIILGNANNGNINNEMLIKNIRNKILGLGPLNIKVISELDDIIMEIENEIRIVKIDLTHEADLTMEYSQESKIVASGNIYVEGKGVFSSEVKASKKIIFMNKLAVCRGGALEAEELIDAGIVGSTSSTITELKVAQKGKILIKQAYINTILYFGKKKYIFDAPAKNIESFITSDGTIVINKLKV